MVMPLEYYSMIGAKMRITLFDGSVYEGEFGGPESEFDSFSGKQEIELDTGKNLIGFPEDEIASVELLE